MSSCRIEGVLDVLQNLINDDDIHCVVCPGERSRSILTTAASMPDAAKPDRFVQILYCMTIDSRKRLSHEGKIEATPCTKIEHVPYFRYPFKEFLYLLSSIIQGTINHAP